MVVSGVLSSYVSSTSSANGISATHSTNDFLTSSLRGLLFSRLITTGAGAGAGAEAGETAGAGEVAGAETAPVLGRGLGTATGLSWVLGAGTGLLALMGAVFLAAASGLATGRGAGSVPLLQVTWFLCGRIMAGDSLGGGGGGLEGGVSMVESEVLKLSPVAEWEELPLRPRPELLLRSLRSEPLV